MQKGKIILIEGTDKSGKQTQSRMLVERLRNENIPVETMSFPRYNTPTGRIVGECYLGKGGSSWFEDANNVDPRIASLYFATDRLAAQNKIKDIIFSGRNLILDRYVESNMAHQGGKETDPQRRLNIIDFIQKLEYRFLKLLPPDKTIFLHMPYQVGIELGKNMNEEPDGHESNPEHLKNAEGTYLLLAENPDWITIECAPNGFPPRTPNEIHEEVYEHVKKELGS